MNQNEKFEADIREVEKILDRAKAGLMNLMPELESSAPRMTGEHGVESATAPDAGKPAAEESGEPPAPQGHFGWFHFLTHKS